jgi:tRNA (guanosine-2'-O-)-methyltransferase
VDLEIHQSTESGLTQLKREGFTLAVADAGTDAVDYREVDYTKKLAIIVGAELEGPTRYARENADFSIAIPMHGLVESLNVSVATAVILFEAERQRRLAGLYESCRLDPEHRARKLFKWAHPDIAQRCEDKGIAYPALTEDGDLAENPF